MDACNSTRRVAIYTTKLELEFPVLVVCVFSVATNLFTLLIVSGLRKRGRRKLSSDNAIQVPSAVRRQSSVNGSSPFLLSLCLLVTLEIALCLLRVVYASLVIRGLLRENKTSTDEDACREVLLSPREQKQRLLDFYFWAAATVLQMCRSWWLVCITAQRVLLVCFPLHSHLALRDLVVRRLFSVILLIGSVISIPMYYLCAPRNDDLKKSFDFGEGDAAAAAALVVLFVMTNGAPVLFVAILTACVAVSLYWWSQKMKRASNTTASDVDVHSVHDSASHTVIGDAVLLESRRRHRSSICNGDGTLHCVHRAGTRSSRRATRTALLIALCFLIFQLPMLVLTVITVCGLREQKVDDLFYVCVNMIYLDTLSNCGVLLVANKVFRRAFYRYICHCGGDSVGTASARQFRRQNTSTISLSWRLKTMRQYSREENLAVVAQQEVVALIENPTIDSPPPAAL